MASGRNIITPEVSRLAKPICPYRWIHILQSGKEIFMEKNQLIIALNGQLQGTIADYKPIIKKEDSIFIAADGGALLLEKLGVIPDILVGDFDSITGKKLTYYRKKNVKIVQYPVEKDETDGELALKYSLVKYPGKNIIIIGTQGGRLDQQLANILLLEYGYYHGLKVLIKEPGLEMGLIVKKVIFNNCEGESLSLIPLSKVVSGVTIKGCKYELKNEQLFRYKTRGISNLVIEKSAELSIKEGIVIYLKQTLDKK